jgi:hypothetical protein
MSAVRKVINQFRGDFQRQRALANAANPDKGDQPTYWNELHQGAENRFPTHHASQWGGEGTATLPGWCDLGRWGLNGLVDQDSRECIAPSRHIQDIATIGFMVPQGATQGRNVDPEVGLFDHGVGPYRRNQVAFVDYVSGAVDQCQQNIECPTAQANLAVALRQDPLGSQNTERSKSQCGLSGS